MASETFKKEFLDAHNEYRAKHQAPALKYSSELCANAQMWAEELLERKKLGHSDTDDGENVFYMSSTKPFQLAGEKPVESWYNEIKDYNFKKPGFQPSTGHFTQVVWKDSKELGLGVATDGKTYFVVGQYRPAGNMNCGNYYENNVVPEK